MTDWIYRIDFEGRDSGGVTSTFRYATRGYVTTPAHPTLPNAFIDGRLIQPLLFRRDLYGENRAYGPMDIGHGSVTLVNADGALDSLVTTYGFDVQKIWLYRIDPAAIDTEQLEWFGVMEQFTLDLRIATILVRDYTYVYDRALQPDKYAGTNVLPAGFEGIADDLKGKPKPFPLGFVFNVEPPLVNSSRLIYQAGDNLGADVLALYDSRVALALAGPTPTTVAELDDTPVTATVSSVITANFPPGPNRDGVNTTAPHGMASGTRVIVQSTGTLPAPLVASQAYYVYAVSPTQLAFYNSDAAAVAGGTSNWIDLTTAGSGVITVKSNSTPPGRYDAVEAAKTPAPGGSFVRLGSLPTGRVTVDLGAEYAPAMLDSSWKDCIKGLLQEHGAGVPYQVEDLAPLVPVLSHCGFYWQEEINLYAALAEVLAAGNGSLQCYPYRTTSSSIALAIHRLEAPAAPSRLDIDEVNVLSLNRIQSGDQQRGIPPYRIQVRYRKNYTVMVPAEIAGSAQADTFPRSEWRVVTQDTAAVLNRFPGAPELAFNSYLYSESMAATFASYLSTLYADPTRGMYTMQIPMELIDGLTYVGAGGTIPGLLLGDVVKVTYPRFNMNAGKYLAVLGYTLDYQKRLVDLTVWG